MVNDDPRYQIWSKAVTREKLVVFDPPKEWYRVDPKDGAIEKRTVWEKWVHTDPYTGEETEMLTYTNPKTGNKLSHTEQGNFHIRFTPWWSEAVELVEGYANMMIQEAIDNITKYKNILNELGQTGERG